jgi:hypothetical protein
MSTAREEGRQLDSRGMVGGGGARRARLHPRPRLRGLQRQILKNRMLPVTQTQPALVLKNNVFPTTILLFRRDLFLKHVKRRLIDLTRERERVRERERERERERRGLWPEGLGRGWTKNTGERGRYAHLPASRCGFRCYLSVS